MLRSSRAEVRQRLIDSTIRVVARDGLDRATTKAISCEAGINEVYIYRLFNDKEHLFECTYDMLDDEMIACITKNLSLIDETEGLSECEKAWLFFARCWEFLLGNREKCSYFIKYYYSRFYDGYPTHIRAQKYESVRSHFSCFLKDSALAARLQNHIFDMVFSTVIKVIRGELPDDDKTAKELFDFIYNSVAKYFR